MIIITLFITKIIRTNLKEGGTVDEDGGSGGGGGGEQVSKCRHRKQHRRGEHMPSTLAHCLNSFFAQQSELFALFEQKEESTCHGSHLCICATIVLLCVQKIALRKK